MRDYRQDQRLNNPTFNFTKISNDILLETRLTTQERFLLCLLASFNPCYPSLRRLAALSGTKRTQTIHERLKSLRRMKVIDWAEGQSGKANQYIFLDSSEWNLAGRQHLAEIQNEIKAQNKADKERRKERMQGLIKKCAVVELKKWRAEG